MHDLDVALEVKRLRVLVRRKVRPLAQQIDEDEPDADHVHEEPPMARRVRSRRANLGDFDRPAGFEDAQRRASAASRPRTCRGSSPTAA